MSKNGEGVACFSYGRFRCRQLTPIKVLLSWIIVLQEYMPKASTPKRARSSGMENPRYRYPKLLGFMSCYRTV